MIVAGANVARTIGLRASLRSRFQLSGVESVAQSAKGGGWEEPGLFLSTFPLDSMLSPGYFDAAKVRANIESFAATIGLNSSSPYSPCLAIRPGPSYGWAAHGPSAPFTNAAFFALICIHADQVLHDPTVWSARIGTCITAMDGVPRDASGTTLAPYNAGNLNDDSQCISEFDWMDVVLAKGKAVMSTVMLAWAYQEIARVATLKGETSRATSCTNSANALIAGLASLRRSDGFYNHDSVQNQVPNVLATAVAVSKNLCGSSANRLASANALRDAYLAGTIAYRGGLRYLPVPNFFGRMVTWPTIGSGPRRFPTYMQVNGGFWYGWWARHLYDALTLASDPSSATQLLGEQVSAMLWLHRCARVEGCPVTAQWQPSGPQPSIGATGWAPREFIARPDQRPASYSIPTTDYVMGANNYGGYGLNGWAAACLMDLTDDPSVQSLDLTLNAGNGYSSTLDVTAHRTMGFSLSSTTPATCTVRLSGRALISSEADSASPTPAYGAWSTICDLSLSGATSAVAAVGTVFPDRSVFGGQIKAEVISGSGAGIITARAIQGGAVTMTTGSTAQPIPPGYVVEWGLADSTSYGPRGTALVTGEEASLPSSGTVYLRDHTGALVATATAPVRFLYGGSEPTTTTTTTTTAAPTPTTTTTTTAPPAPRALLLGDGAEIPLSDVGELRIATSAGVKCARLVEPTDATPIRIATSVGPKGVA
jgi:hypothetical protein